MSVADSLWTTADPSPARLLAAADNSTEAASPMPRSTRADCSADLATATLARSRIKSAAGDVSLFSPATERIAIDRYQSRPVMNRNPGNVTILAFIADRGWGDWVVAQQLALDLIVGQETERERQHRHNDEADHGEEAEKNLAHLISPPNHHLDRTRDGATVLASLGPGKRLFSFSRTDAGQMTGIGHYTDKSEVSVAGIPELMGLV